jgi:hypothetical protein
MKACSMRARRRSLFVVTFLLPALIGCGNDLASVQGTVSLDGQPINGGPQIYGTVTFYSESGQGAPATAIIDESGHYSLKTGGQDGVAPGTYLVGIAVKRVEPAAADSGMPKATLITPRRYASVAESGFRETVSAGDNTIDFSLISK